MEVSFETLKTRMEITQDKDEYKRLRAVYLNKAEKVKAADVAHALGTTLKMVYRYNGLYNKYGIDGLINKPRGGRRWAYMSLEDEKQMMDALASGAADGLVVITKAIKIEAEKRLGFDVSPDYAEQLLHRHGWRKVEPRPRHPKSSKEKQEEFKKKFQNLSMKR